MHYVRVSLVEDPLLFALSLPFDWQQPSARLLLQAKQRRVTQIERRARERHTQMIVVE
jgi:hypothetical protein